MTDGANEGGASDEADRGASDEADRGASDEADRGGDGSGLDEDAFEAEIPVRYSDVDTYGHVNNAVFATYLEEARIDYLEAVLGGDASDLLSEDREADGIVVASLEIEYRRPLALVDAVTVRVGIPEIGHSSFSIVYEVESDAGVVATAETTMVAYDRSERASVALPDPWREKIVAFEDY